MTWPLGLVWTMQPTGLWCDSCGAKVALTFPSSASFPRAQVVKLCRECLKKQEPVLGDTNIYLLRILSIASEVLSYLQMFEEAADYAKRMVDGYLYVCALFWVALSGYSMLGSVL